MRGQRPEADRLLPRRRVLAHRMPRRALTGHGVGLSRPASAMRFKTRTAWKKSKRWASANNCFAHSSIISPARGSHFRNSPSRWLVVTISFENELIEQYSPRKRSRTEANRKTPLPEKRSLVEVDRDLDAAAEPAADVAGHPPHDPPAADAQHAVDHRAGLGRIGEVVELEDFAQGVGALFRVGQRQMVQRQVGDQPPDGAALQRRPQGGRGPARSGR